MAYGRKRYSSRAKAAPRGRRSVPRESAYGSRRTGGSGGRGPQTIKIVLQTVAQSPVAAAFGQKAEVIGKKAKF